MLAEITDLMRGIRLLVNGDPRFQEQKGYVCAQKQSNLLKRWMG